MMAKKSAKTFAASSDFLFCLVARLFFLRFVSSSLLLELAKISSWQRYQRKRIIDMLRYYPKKPTIWFNARQKRRPQVPMESRSNLRPWVLLVGQEDVFFNLMHTRQIGGLSTFARLNKRLLRLKAISSSYHPVYIVQSWSILSQQTNLRRSWIHSLAGLPESIQHKLNIK